MGTFDVVWVPCPKCGTRYDAQSKGGACKQRIYELHEAPPDVLSDVNRHAPFWCDVCGTAFEVSLNASATLAQVSTTQEHDG